MMFTYPGHMFLVVKDEAFSQSIKFNCRHKDSTGSLVKIT